MRITIYFSRDDSSLFVLLPRQADPAWLPAHVKVMLGRMMPFKDCELSENRRRLGVNSVVAMKDIKTKGYHVCRATLGMGQIMGSEVPRPSALH